MPWTRLVVPPGYKSPPPPPSSFLLFFSLFLLLVENIRFPAAHKASRRFSRPLTPIRLTALSNRFIKRSFSKSSVKMSLFSLFGIFGFLDKLVELPMDKPRERQFAALFGDAVCTYDDMDGETGSLWDNPIASQAIQHATVKATVLFVLLCLLSMVIQHARPFCQTVWSWLRFVLAARVWAVLSPTALHGAYDAVVGWYFPFNRPFDSIIRIFLSFVAFVTAYSHFLLPVVWYLSGFSEGLNASSWELSPYCWDARERRHRGLTAKSIPVEHWFCLGEEASLELQARFVDLLDARNHPNFDDDNMHHLTCLAVFLSLLGVLSIFRWFFRQPTVEEHLFSQAELTERVFSYYGVVRKLEARLDSRLKELARYREALSASERRLVGALTENERLKNELRSAEVHESTIAQLHQKISQLRCDRRNALFEVMELRDELEMGPRYRSDVTKLTKQLADTEEMAADAQKESESLRGQREDANRQLAAVRWELTAANNELAAARKLNEDLRREGQALLGRYEGLQNSYNRLSEAQRVLGTSDQHRLVVTERDEAVSRATTAQAERDQAVSRVNTLEAELASMKAQAQQQQVRLQQASNELSSSVQAQRRQAAEVNTLNGRCQQLERTNGDLQTALTFAQNKAKNLEVQCEDLREKLDKVSTDFEMSQDTARQLQKENRALEHRLANMDPSGGTQAIPKRRTGETNRSEQERSRVQIVCQANEINDLKRQIEALKASRVAEPTDAALRGQVDQLREELAAVNRARSDEEIASRRQVTQLEQEVQRLRIALSNARMFGQGRGTGSPLRGSSSPLRAPGSRGRGR